MNNLSFDDMVLTFPFIYTICLNLLISFRVAGSEWRLSGSDPPEKRTQPDKILGKANAVCPRSNGPFHIVSYYIKCVTTSWTRSSNYLYINLLPQ